MAHRAMGQYSFDKLPRRRTANLSIKATLDWTILIASLILGSFAVFMIGNGSCSSGLKQTYEDKNSQRGLCIGHHYSMSIWLAIVGVEFSISGTLILPRLHALVVSKILTKNLMNGEVKLSTILNSQSTAPVLTQARYGLRRLFLWRVLILILVAAASISYKFSFVPTNGYGSILQSSIITGLGDRNDADSQIFPEILLGVTGSYYTSGGQSMMRVEEDEMDSGGYSANGTSGLILGPSFNTTTVEYLVDGNVSLCYPNFYTRSTFYEATAPLPIIEEQTPLLSERFTDSRSQQTVQISATANGSLQAFSGNASSPGSLWAHSKLVTTKLCYGYVSWYALGSSVEMWDPTDITCWDEPFNITEWNSTDYHGIATGLIQSKASSFYLFWGDLDTNSPGWQDKFSIEFLNSVVDIVLASANYTTSILRAKSDAYWDHDYSSSALQPAPNTACKLVTNASGEWYWDQNDIYGRGVLAGAGTGMTWIGMALQAVMVIVCLSAIGILAWPALPLIREWPAQWIGLVSELDLVELDDALHGTSTGSNHVGGDIMLHITSSIRNGEQVPRLRLSPVKGALEVGKEHG